MKDRSEYFKEWARQFRNSEKGKKYKKEYEKKNRVKINEQRVERYYKNIDKERSTARENSKKHHKKMKILLYELLGGCVCVECGCTILEALEINHINGGGAKEEKQKGGTTTHAQRYRELVKEPNLIKNFNVLCRLCNAHHYLRDLKGVAGGTWKVIFTPNTT